MDMDEIIETARAAGWIDEENGREGYHFVAVDPVELDREDSPSWWRRLREAFRYV